MTANDIGPIARKIIAAGRKQQRQQIVDLQVARRARDEMRRIIDIEWRFRRATLAISIPGLRRTST